MNCDELFRFERMEPGYIIAEYLRKDDPGITEIEIPSEYRSETVDTIGTMAFRGAKYLRSVFIPDSVDFIGSAAFDSCESLKSVRLSENLITINDDAFADCVSLEEITLPRSLKVIEGAVFDGCTSLRSVVFQSSGVFVGKYTFDDCPALPAETVMRALVPADDITEPFVYAEDEGFDWWTALRRDVFELAMEYDSFSKVDKSMLFYMIFDEELFAEYLPLMRRNDWIYRGENLGGFERLLADIYAGSSRDLPEIWENSELWMTDNRLFAGIVSIAAQNKEAEFAAWLLELKRRKYGFDGGESEYDI